MVTLIKMKKAKMFVAMLLAVSVSLSGVGPMGGTSMVRAANEAVNQKSDANGAVDGAAGESSEEVGNTDNTGNANADTNGSSAGEKSSDSETTDPSTDAINQDEQEESLEDLDLAVEEDLKADGIDSNNVQWYLDAIKLPEAQTLISEYSQETVGVAVLDTGLRLSHVEFDGVVNTDLAWDCINNAPLSGDSKGHGTRVAGLIAAKGANMKGVAANTVELIPVAVTTQELDRFETLNNVIKGFEYIKDIASTGKADNLRVVNLSISLPRTVIAEDAGSRDYNTRIDYLKSLITELRNTYNILTVAAGGNIVVNNTPFDDYVIPSDFDVVLGVTATDKIGDHVQGFCYNEHKNISAPGVEMYTTTNAGDSAYVDDLSYSNGTSFATPVVSGLAALICSVNPGLSASEVSDIITSTASPLPKSFKNTSNGTQHDAVNGSKGLINAKAALEKAVVGVDKNSGGTEASNNLYGSGAGKTWYVSFPDGQGNDINTGDGSSSKPFTQLTRAVENAGDGDTIIIRNKAFVNDIADNGNSKPLIINNNITIKGEGDHPDINFYAAGILLNGNVTFNNVTISFSNTNRNAIIANGHTLVLDSVDYASGGQGVNLVCGGVVGYSGSTLPSPGSHGEIIIKNGYKLGQVSLSDNTSKANIYAGNLAEDMFVTGEQARWEAQSTITVESMNNSEYLGDFYATGAIKTAGLGIVLDGKTTVNPPTASDRCNVTGNVTVNLNSTAIRNVYGNQGNEKYANVTYKDTSRLSGLNKSVYLDAIGNLSVDATANFEPKTGSGFATNDATISIASGGFLNLKNMGSKTSSDLTIKNLNGGGGLCLGTDQILTITNSISGTTTLFVNELNNGQSSGEVTVDHSYIKATSSKDGDFISATLPSTQSNLVLQKDDAGNWTFKGNTGGSSEDDTTKVITCTVPEVTVDVGEYVSMPINLDVVYGTDPYLDFVPLSSVFIKGIELYRYEEDGEILYYSSSKYTPRDGDMMLEVYDNTLHFTKYNSTKPAIGDPLDAGVYSVSFYIPKTHTRDGSAIRVNTTLTVKAKEKPESEIIYADASTPMTDQEQFVYDNRLKKDEDYSFAYHIEAAEPAYVTTNSQIQLNFLDASGKKINEGVKWFYWPKGHDDFWGRAVSGGMRIRDYDVLWLDEKGMVYTGVFNYTQKENAPLIYAIYKGELFKFQIDKIMLTDTAQENLKERERMQQEVDAAIEKLITDLDLNNKSKIEKVRAVHDHLATNVKYENSLEGLGYNNLQMLYYTLVKPKEGQTAPTAVCSGYSWTFKKIMERLGITCEMLTGKVRNSASEAFDRQHAWNAVYIDDGWYYLDITWAATGGNYDKTNANFYKYFLMPQDEFCKTHETKINLEMYPGLNQLGTKYLGYKGDNGSSTEPVTWGPSLDGDENFSNLVVFVDFSDTNHPSDSGNEADDKKCYATKAGAKATFEEYFDGDANHPRAMKQYLKKISFGEFRQANFFPQFDSQTGTITPLRVTHNSTYHANMNNDIELVQEVAGYLSRTNACQGMNLDLCKRINNLDDTGVLDNLTIVVSGDNANAASFTGHKASYPGNDVKINNLLIRSYNVVHEQGLYKGMEKEGLIIHEFMHSLGYPDLYRSRGADSKGSPVGRWDIMSSVHHNVQFPLAYTRSVISGWLPPLEEISSSRTGIKLYAPTAATSKLQKQAAILKSPSNPKEVFVVEYRKQPTGSAMYDGKTLDVFGGSYKSGLIIYRVNLAKGNLYNTTTGGDAIYVFRPGDTKATSEIGENGNGKIQEAALSSDKVPGLIVGTFTERVSTFGSADPNASTEQNAITYTDGKNSGIIIKNVGTTEGDTITFDVEFSDFSKYSITYKNIDNITNKNEFEDYYTAGDLPVQIKEPIRPGYKFEGWYKDSGYKTKFDKNSLKTPEISQGTKGNQTLYAKWTRYKLTIHFDSDCGPEGLYGSKKDIVIPYYEDVKDAVSVGTEGYSRSGYDFVGWKVPQKSELQPAFMGEGGENFFGEILQSGNKVTNNFTKEKDLEVTLTAQWKAVERFYYLILNGNGASTTSTTMNSIKIPADSSAPDNKFTKKGHKFVGWNTVAKPTIENPGILFENNDKLSELPLKEKGKENEAIMLYAQWEPIEYPITYYDMSRPADKNVTSETSNPSTYTIVSDTITIDHRATPEGSSTDGVDWKNPTREGYIFAGWYTDKKCTKKAKTINKGTIENKVFYAKWTPIRYDIEFNKGENSQDHITGSMASMKNCVYGKKYTLSANRFKLNQEEIEFAGWSYNYTPESSTSGSAVDLVNKQSVTAIVATDTSQAGLYEHIITETATGRKVLRLYACWKPKEYTITYKGIGTGAEYENPNPAVYTKADSDIKLKTPTRVGYDFAGWYTDSRMTKPEGDLKADDVAVQTSEGVNKTFYAKWTPRLYNIVFEPGKEIDDKNVDVKITGDMDSVSLKNCKYNTNYTLPAVKFKKANYDFAGWKVKVPDDAAAAARIPQEIKDATFGNKKKVKNLSVGIATDSGNETKVDTVTLEAQWKRTSYTITYSGLTASERDAAHLPSTYTYFDEIMLKDMTSYKKGYKFDGWYTNSVKTKPAGGLSYDSPAINKNTTVNKVFYAKWTPYKYNIKFVSGNDPDIRKEVTKTMKNLANRNAGTKYTLTSNAFVRKGYTFVGWKIASEVEGNWTSFSESEAVYVGADYNLQQQITDKTLLDNKAKVSHTNFGIEDENDNNKTAVLVAQWKPTVYKATYKNMLKGTSGVKADVTMNYTIESGDLIHPEPARIGYSFGGWYTDSKFKKPSDRIAANSTGNKTYYTKWMPNKYTISFEGGHPGAILTSPMNPIEAEVDKTVTLPSNKYVVEGYTFDGWKVKVPSDVAGAARIPTEIKGATFGNKKKVKNLTTGISTKLGVPMQTDTITLVAQWVKK